MSRLINGHLSQDLIFRTLDDELTAAENAECESHLAVCESCRLQLAALHEFSMAIETVVHTVPVPSMLGSRRQVQQTIETSISRTAAVQSPALVMRRFGWGMGIAATLALGVMLAPKSDLWHGANSVAATQDAMSAGGASIEVDGETFLAVPYSNGDVPTATPHIVQMEVPVSSLADVGIMLEPLASAASGGTDSERSVLADVLVGADGQPRGVHVLGFE